MPKIPSSLTSGNNLEILAHIQFKSCHGDIVEPISEILKPLDDVHWFCPDPGGFAYCCWYTNEVVFAVGTGMHEIGVRLPPKVSEDDRRPGDFMGRFDDSEWWAIRWNLTHLKDWATMAYKYAKENS